VKEVSQSTISQNTISQNEIQNEIQPSYLITELKCLFSLKLAGTSERTITLTAINLREKSVRAV